MATLAFSYAHADEQLRNELEVHLAPLRREGLIDPWHDRRILAGQEFKGEIDLHFEAADIILLLVSPDFIASNYCYDVEMKQALERHNRGEATVIPVILRPCHWQDLPFGKLLAATPDGKPVTRFATTDDGFYQVVGSIKRAVRARSGMSNAVAPSGSLVENAEKFPESSALKSDRSSNLRIKREFTDHDRDLARTKCFEFVARFFQNSLEELKQRNPEIETDFQLIDSRSFEASIYVQGTRQSSCGIWIDAKLFRGDILYSQSGVSPGSFNESVSIESNGYTLGFKPLGMQLNGREQRGMLNQEGVAEYFWEILIGRLQR